MNNFSKFTAEDYKRKQEYDEALLEAMGDLYREIDYNDGKKAGIEIGRSEGELNKSLSFLRKLLSENFDDETIKNLMQINEKELEGLKKMI